MPHMEITLVVHVSNRCKNKNQLKYVLVFHETFKFTYTSISTWRKSVSGKYFNNVL